MIIRKLGSYLRSSFIAVSVWVAISLHFVEFLWSNAFGLRRLVMSEKAERAIEFDSFNPLASAIHVCKNQTVNFDSKIEWWMVKKIPVYRDRCTPSTWFVCSFAIFRWLASFVVDIRHRHTIWSIRFTFLAYAFRCVNSQRIIWRGYTNFKRVSKTILVWIIVWYWCTCTVYTFLPIRLHLFPHRSVSHPIISRS